MSVTPDRWCLVQIDQDLVKVVASWGGSYLEGESWQINSGISKVEENEDYFIFHGQSGSIYKCRKGCYGINCLASHVLSKVKRAAMKEAAAIRYIRKMGLDIKNLK